MPGPQRARPAGPEQADSRSCTELPFLATSYLEIAHWSLLLRGIEGHGDDLEMKMAVLLQGHAFCAWTAMDPSGYAIFSLKSTH